MFRFCDSCDSYTAAKDLQNIWDEAGVGWGPALGEGVRGGGALKADGPAMSAIRKNIRWAPFQQNEDFAVMRSYMWVKIAEPPDARTPFLYWRDPPGSSSPPDSPAGLPILMSPAGELMFFANHGSTAAIPDTTEPLYTSPGICDNRWHSLEILQWGRPDPSGVLRVVLDNFVLINDDTLSLSKSTFWMLDYTLLSLYSVGKPMWVDDFIVWDDRQTQTYNNEFYSPIDWYPEWGNDGFMGDLSGPKVITTGRPTADGDKTNWSSSELTHAAAVDEQTADFRETVIIADSFGLQDLFTFDPLPTNLTGITAVITSVQARATEYGSVTLKPLAKSGAVTKTDLFRQRVVGKHVVEQDLNQPELISNPGLPFVDTAGWVANYPAIELSIVNGELRIHNIGETYTWTGGAITPIACEIGRQYVVKIARSLEYDGTSGSSHRLGLRVSDDPNGAAGASGYLIQDLSLLPGEVGFGIFTAPAETMYVFAEASPTPGAWTQMSYATARLAIEGPKHHLKQWAFTQDPELEAAWGPEGVNAAQFGIEATYLPEGHI